jgi:alpha-L-fucosidase 2
VRGLRARGGLTVDLSWRDGHLAEGTVTAHQPIRVRIRSEDRVSDVVLAAGEAFTLRGE